MDHLRHTCSNVCATGLVWLDWFDIVFLIDVIQGACVNGKFRPCLTLKFRHSLKFARCRQENTHKSKEISINSLGVAIGSVPCFKQNKSPDYEQWFWSFYRVWLLGFWSLLFSTIFSRYNNFLCLLMHIKSGSHNIETSGSLQQWKGSERAPPGVDPLAQFGLD